MTKTILNKITNLLNIFRKTSPQTPYVINLNTLPKEMTNDEKLLNFKSEMARVCLSKAYPTYDKETCGYCAKAIRIATEQVLGCKLEREESAKDYGGSYEKIGFKKIFSYPSGNKPDYKPETGDICIIQYDPHGHICMFTGKKWVSDFIQLDMYGGKIRNQDPPFSIYRLTDLEKIG